MLGSRYVKPVTLNNTSIIDPLERSQISQLNLSRINNPPIEKNQSRMTTQVYQEPIHTPYQRQGSMISTHNARQYQPEPQPNYPPPQEEYQPKSEYPENPERNYNHYDEDVPMSRRENYQTNSREAYENNNPSRNRIQYFEEPQYREDQYDNKVPVIQYESRRLPPIIIKKSEEGV